MLRVLPLLLRRLQEVHGLRLFPLLLALPLHVSQERGDVWVAQCCHQGALGARHALHQLLLCHASQAAAQWHAAACMAQSTVALGVRGEGG